MLNNCAVCSRALLRVLFVLLFAVSSLTSCGGSSTSTNISPGGGIVLSLVPARTSGVAPLAVFFDASATTDTGVTTHPFHDLEYRWNFGDAASGTWANGAQPGVSSKNSATGPVAAHVFETPGTYTISLTAFDGTNPATTNTTITVQDPNIVFAGTNTVCVSANSLPTQGVGGCPSGAAVAQQASFPTIVSSYATTGKRVLLKRGDTFASPSVVSLVNTGPGILGAYGSGVKPQINHTGNDTLLGFSTTSAGNSVPGFSDWRIMDLSMDGAGTSNSMGIAITSGNGGVRQLTILRVDLARFEVGFGVAGDGLNWDNNQNGRVHTVDQYAVIESSTTNGNNTSYSGYNSGNRIAFMGNSFENGGLQTRYDELGNPLGAGTHVLRFPFLNKAVISNNHILHPGGTRHAIKLHAPFWNGGVPDQTAGNWSNYSVPFNGDGYSKYVVISDNYLLSAQEPWQITISPQDSINDERVHDVILERNYHVGTIYTQVAQRICAREVTSRNNIFSANGSPSYTTFALVDLDGLEPPANNVWIYNNTVYKPAGPVNGSDGFAIVDMPDTGVSNITIKNNLGWAPTLTGSVPYVNAGITGLTQSNNSTTAQINNSTPLFAAPPPNYIPLAGSYAINGGTTVPVWTDFFLNIRPQGVIDIGAVEAP